MHVPVSSNTWKASLESAVLLLLLVTEIATLCDSKSAINLPQLRPLVPSSTTLHFPGGAFNFGRMVRSFGLQQACPQLRDRSDRWRLAWPQRLPTFLFEVCPSCVRAFQIRAMTQTKSVSTSFPPHMLVRHTKQQLCVTIAHSRV